MTTSWPHQWFDTPIAVFDLETTGFDFKTCQIIEIGIVQFLRGEVVKVHNWLVNPECIIPREIVELTNITQADVDDKLPFRDIAKDVLEAFRGHAIVAYNIAFDRPFLTQKLVELGYAWPSENPTLDPLVFANHFFPYKTNKLGAVAERLGISLEGAHRACNDAEATGKILYAFRDKLPPDMESLLIVQAQWERANLERQHWRKNQAAGLNTMAQPQGLSIAFAYGNEPDPLRALYAMIPNAKPKV